MHDWNVNPKEAIAIQKELRDKLVIAPYTRQPRLIAGADVSLNMFEKDIYAGIVVLDAATLAPVAASVVRTRTNFPYIPGLLSFREIPALLACWERLAVKPDVVFVDGQGIAHPRRLGIAAHFGILAGVPTVGVGKSRLYGAFETPTEVGDAREMRDPKSGEIIGYAYKSKKNSNPLIISPGHKTDPESALGLVKQSLRGYRLPEPTRRAHALVNAFRTGEDLQEYGRGNVSIFVTP